MVMEEIMALKESGYSIQEVIAHFECSGQKVPSKPTLRKYFQMSSIPEDPFAPYAKDKVFDHPPFREVIIEILRNCKDTYCVSSVYDVLEEKFVDGGEYEKLPGNEQTLRNYIAYLVNNKIIDSVPKNQRIYEHVFDTAPGDQMLLDFGEKRLSGGKQVHFICLLLRYSRLFCVYAQDHKYNAEEACRDIYRAIRKLGGRPRQFVIDQDAVFIVSEIYGEVIETRIFKEFCAEQDIGLWVCNKADPESKGGVENLVGFVKKNYFSARKTIESVDDVWETLPGWVERKGRRIHKATYCVPAEVFKAIEQKALRPLIPSVYENLPSSYERVSVGSTPYIQYKSCKYSVPRGYCFKTVCYKVAGDKIHIYDEKRKYICSHVLSDRKGSFNQLPEHKKEDSEDWKPVAERLRAKWTCYDFQHFINGFKKENPRHLYKQLTAVESFLDSQSPPKELVAEVMSMCCAGYRYRFTQFQQVYFLAKSGYATTETVALAGVARQGMDAYRKAFEERCEQ
jgi:hypothetical protein